MAAWSGRQTLGGSSAQRPFVFNWPPSTHETRTSQKRESVFLSLHFPSGIDCWGPQVLLGVSVACVLAVLVPVEVRSRLGLQVLLPLTAVRPQPQASLGANWQTRGIADS